MERKEEVLLKQNGNGCSEQIIQRCLLFRQLLFEMALSHQYINGLLQCYKSSLADSSLQKFQTCRLPLMKCVFQVPVKTVTAADFASFKGNKVHQTQHTLHMNLFLLYFLRILYLQDFIIVFFSIIFINTFGLDLFRFFFMRRGIIYSSAALPVFPLHNKRCFIVFMSVEM